MSTSCLFDRITEEENFYKSYKQTQKGKNKYKKPAMLFALNETYNLLKLRQSLIDGTYRFGHYIEFIVYEPKERLINAPELKDKIVQLAVYNIIKEIYFPTFIHDSYSCIDDKGTHKCAKRIQHFMQKAKWEYGEGAFVIKMDIRKFFYSIDRDILKSMLPKKIKCKKTLALLYEIIDSADTIDKIGLPLGNTLSQLFANIYMNKADQYAKRKLSLKYYIRYADDIVIVVENKQKAQEVLQLIGRFINKELHLKLNKKKTKIFPINQGVNAIGYKIYPTHMLLRDDSKKRIKRKTKAMPHLIREGKLTVERAERMLNSWKGHAEFACSYNFIQDLVNKNDFLYLKKKKNGKTVFKIDVSKIYKEGDLCVA